MIKIFYDLYTTLNRKSNFVLEVTKNTDDYYYEKRQPKKKFGKNQLNKDGTIRYRDLVPPVRALKIMQKKILSDLKEIRHPACMYGSIEGKNNVLNALRHLEGKYFLSVDLKNFFQNISNGQVHKTLMNKGYSWNIARVITKLVTFKGSLPQGSPTSPIIANLVTETLAFNLQSFAEQHQLTFTAFLDDLTFSSSKAFKNLIPEILQITINCGFFPNHKKIHYREDRCEITGLVVDKGRLKLIPDMKTRIENNKYLKKYNEVIEFYYKNYSNKKKDL